MNKHDVWKGIVGVVFFPVLFPAMLIGCLLFGIWMIGRTLYASTIGTMLGDDFL